MAEQSEGGVVISRVVNWFLNDDHGASMVEYALLVALIATVALVAVRLAGTELSLTYSEIASEVAGARP
jgi:pilus assembly protein Flp/PilA